MIRQSSYLRITAKRLTALHEHCVCTRHSTPNSYAQSWKRLARSIPRQHRTVKIDYKARNRLGACSQAISCFVVKCLYPAACSPVTWAMTSSSLTLVLIVACPIKNTIIPTNNESTAIPPIHRSHCDVLIKLGIQ